jgi:hypothetical protein
VGDREEQSKVAWKKLEGMTWSEGKGKCFQTLPDNSFSSQNAPKRLAAGFYPDPLGELMRTSKSLQIP